MGTGGRRCARGRPRSWIRSPDVVPPITDRNRGAVLRFQNTKSDERPPFHQSKAVCAFSARARPFSLRLVSPRGALPLRLLARVRVRVRVRVL